jgi:hypothetical protein
MPYSQTKLLTALPEYLEIQGISDIKDLGYGMGRPPKNDEVLMSASISIRVLGIRGDCKVSLDKLIPAVEPLASNTILLTSIMLTGEYNLNRIDRSYHRFNDLHRVFIRLTPDLFLGRFGDLPEMTIAAQQVQLFAMHNMRLHDAALNLDYNPMFYREFIDLMNRYDASGYTWAYYSESEGRIKYPYPELEPATVSALQVCDSDIERRETVRAGNVQVSAEWYNHTIEVNQRREVARERNIRKSQEAKLNFAGLPNIDSPANRAALVRKRKADEAEFQEHRAERRKKQSVGPEEGEALEEAGNAVQGTAPAESTIASLSTSLPNVAAAVAPVDSTSLTHPITVALTAVNLHSSVSSPSTIRAPSPAPSSIEGSFANSMAGSVAGSLAGSVAGMSPYGDNAQYSAGSCRNTFSRYLGRV